MHASVRRQLFLEMEMNSGIYSTEPQAVRWIIINSLGIYPLSEYHFQK